MAVTYLRLFPATTQFVMKNGMLNVAGLLHIYLEGTDDLAPVFDTDGSQLQQPVMLDNDGRARGLFVDASKVYWMKVCDRDDSQIYTVRKMVPSGGGAGSALGNTYQVISSDGTVNVTEFVNAGTTTFDLSCDIDPEASKWGSAMSMRASLDGDDTWAEVPIIATTGSMTYQNGWAATKDCLGDIAASIAMTGSATATHTIDTKLVVTVDGTEVYSEQGLLDPTESCGLVSFSWKGELAESQKVDARIYVKSTESMSVGLIGRVFYNEECDGVVGGEGTTYVPGTGIDIAGDVISVTGMQPVSAMSAYVQTSGITGLMPVSGMSAYVEQTAFDACCSAMSAAVSSLENSASSLESGLTSLGTALTSLSSTVSSLTGQYVEQSAISAESAIWNSASAIPDKLDTTAFTNYTASALTGIMQDTAAISSSVSSLETSKVDQSAFDACCSAVEAQVSSLTSDVSTIQQDTGAISAAVSAVTGQTGNYIDWSASGTFQPSGNYVSSDEFSAYTASALTGIQQDTADISAAVSGLTGTYIQYADLESASGFITGISGTALWGGHEYTGVWPIVVDNDQDIISAENKPLCVDETMTGYESAGSAVIGVNTSTVLSGLSAYQLTADMSGYQPSGDYAYNSSLNDYQPVSGMTAYQPSGDYAYNSAVSSKAEQSSLTAYQEITGMSAYQLSGDYAYNSSLSDYQPVSGMTAYQPSGDYAYNSAVSGKQDASAMTAYQLSGDYAYNSSLADYQPVSGMTAYQPSDDYAYNSSLGDYQPVSGMTAYQPSGNYLVPDDITGKADVSSLTAYQEITGMSAYQLSGDYAYNSSLSSYALSADVSGCIDTVSSNSASWGSITSLPITGSAGDDSVVYGETSVEFTRNDSVGEPDYRTASLSTDALSIDYTVDNENYYSMSLREGALEFNSPDGYGIVDIDSISAWNSAYDTVSNESANWAEVSAKADSSALTAYQEVSGMTAYQPVGTYIYESALGWAEV